LEETWEAGESFRSGLIWKNGSGRVFYFRPGHETYPVYKQELPLRIITNAALWLGKSIAD
jgi:trehalose utilization protein